MNHRVEMALFCFAKTYLLQAVRGIITYMNWQIKRRIMYGVAVLFIIIASTLYIYRDTFFPAPTCTDRKQNGYESGMDCGGTCSLRCTEEVLPLTVLWSRALNTSKDTYDLVAMVSNKNINNASYELKYIFKAYDENGVQILRP